MSKSHNTPKVASKADQAGSQLSEQQEALIAANAPEGDTEGSAVEATQHALFVDEVRSIFNSEDDNENRSGDMDYVAELVTEGKLTPEDFQSITTVSFEDYQGDAEQPSETAFQALKMQLEEQVAVGTMPKGDTLRLHIQDLVNGGKITEEQGNALFATFGINEPLDTIGKEILDHYHVTHETIEACREDGEKIYAELIGVKTESDTNKFAKLVNVIADFAVLQHRAGRLPWSNTADETLWARIMEYKLLGDVTIETDDSNKDLGDNTVVIARHDPYRDPVIMQYRKSATRAACLLAYGSVTQVHFGCIEKSKVPGGRVSRRIVFNTGTEGYDEATMFRAVCVPANVLVPNVNKYMRPKVVIEGREVDQWTAVPEKANDDTSSRYLSSEYIDPLFNKYFKGDELVYDMTSTTTVIPTGAIKGSKRPGMPDNAAPTKRQTKGTQAEGADPKDKVIAEQKTMIAELEKDRKATVEAGKSDVLAFLNGLRAYIRDTSQEMTQEARITLFSATNEVLLRRPNTKVPTKEEAIAQTRLLDSLQTNWTWDEAKGTWTWENDAGTLRHEFTLNGDAKAA